MKVAHVRERNAPAGEGYRLTARGRKKLEVQLGTWRRMANAIRALANAPGTGVADDKAIYRYAERNIKYYLDQDAIIPIVLTLSTQWRRFILVNQRSLNGE